MKKKTGFLVCASSTIVLLCGALVLVSSQNFVDNIRNINGVGEDSCIHEGYHYLENRATSTSEGNRECWTCCKCHTISFEHRSGSYQNVTDGKAVQSSRFSDDALLYKVNFHDSSDYLNIDSITNVIKGYPMPQISIEDREGFNFSGFYYNSTKYYNSDGTSAHVFDLDNNVTFEAQWDVIKCTVRILNTSGDQLGNTTTCDYGTDINNFIPSTPIPSAPAGGSLYSYYVDNNLQTKFTGSIKQNLTLYYGYNYNFRAENVRNVWNRSLPDSYYDGGSDQEFCVKTDSLNSINSISFNADINDRNKFLDLYVHDLGHGVGTVSVKVNGTVIPTINSNGITTETNLNLSNNLIHLAFDLSSYKNENCTIMICNNSIDTLFISSIDMKQTNDVSPVTGVAVHEHYFDFVSGIENWNFNGASSGKSGGYEHINLGICLRNNTVMSRTVQVTTGAYHLFVYVRHDGTPRNSTLNLKIKTSEQGNMIASSSVLVNSDKNPDQAGCIYLTADLKGYIGRYIIVELTQTGDTSLTNNGCIIPCVVMNNGILIH